MSIQFRTDDQQSKLGTIATSIILMFLYIIPILGFLIITPIGIKIIKKVSGVSTVLKVLMFILLSLLYVPIIGGLITISTQVSGLVFLGINLLVISVSLAPLFFVLYFNKVMFEAKRAGIDLEI